MTEAKAPIHAVEYNVRLWKTENGWKVTTTAIDGKSRDVTSKLREDISVAAYIAMTFFEKAINDERTIEIEAVEPTALPLIDDEPKTVVEFDDTTGEVTEEKQSFGKRK